MYARSKIRKVVLGHSMKGLEILLTRNMTSRELDNLAGGTQNPMAWSQPCLVLKVKILVSEAQYFPQMLLAPPVPN